MTVRRTLKRYIALLLLGALGFSQVSIALAACFMDRGSMAQASDMRCVECGTADPQPLISVACVAHCTADLQLTAAPVAIVRSAADTPVLVVAARKPPGAAMSRGLESPPPGAPSRRVLLHSYLI
jgi:hypothetical protein